MHQLIEEQIKQQEKLIIIITENMSSNDLLERDEDIPNLIVTQLSHL
jgi:hypothetical protein